MAMIRPFLLFFAFFAHPSLGDETIKCPFNEGSCNCVRTSSTPGFEFKDVTCNSVSLPAFAEASTKYKITGEFILKTDATDIPADQFKAFEEINTLTLTPKSGSRFKQAANWDANAFNNVKITNFAATGLNRLIPPPTALKTMAANLESLTLHNPSEAITLDQNTFGNEFRRLKKLTIDQVPVAVNDNPFAALTALTELNLVDATLPSVPAPIKNMLNLEMLSLSGNRINEIPFNTFSGSTAGKMRKLDLSGNPVTKLDDGIVYAYKDLVELNLKGTKLEQIDLALFSSDSATATDIVLDGDKDLRSLLVRLIDEIHPFARFSIKDTTLEKIDPRLQTLLDTKKNIKIDLSNNAKLQCSNLNWMANVQCPGPITIDDVVCADKNDQSLSSYLKSVNENSKCTGKDSRQPKAASTYTSNFASVVAVALGVIFWFK